MNRIIVFIDSGNLWNVYKGMGRLLDFSKLRIFFSEKFCGKIFRVFYYVAYPLEGTRPQKDIERFQKFLTYLKKGLGFYVIKKPLKTIRKRSWEIEKGNFDVEITIHALKYSKEYDIAIFLSGDSDFLPLINELRNVEKKKVYVFSSAGSVSKELRTGADGYFDLMIFTKLHGKKLDPKK